MFCNTVTRLFGATRFLGIVSVLSFSTIGASFAETSADFCWKDSYGRGAGTIPPQPPTGQFRHWFSNDWYSCPDGYYRSLNLDINAKDACLKDNPAYSKWSGAEDFGNLINNAPNSRAFKDPSYNRWFSCPSNYVRSITHVKSATACIKKGTIWPFEKNDTVTDHGVYQKSLPDRAFGDPNGSYYRCPKKYNRTIFPVTGDNACELVVKGKAPSKSKAKKMGGVCGKQQVDAGLCYDACNSGYTGVGPVCWTSAPKDWVECGMGAAKDDKTCAIVTSDQVISVGSLAMNIYTFGTSKSAEKGIKAAGQAKDLSELQKKLETLKKAYDAASKTKTGKALIKANKVREIGTKAYNAKKEADKAVTAEDIVRVSAMIAAIMDPTGIADVTAAYTYATCEKLFK